MFQEHKGSVAAYFFVAGRSRQKFYLLMLQFFEFLLQRLTLGELEKFRFLLLLDNVCRRKVLC